MKKILVTADWHVGDYLDRGSITERINQFRRLPSRLVEIAKENDTKILAILGDFKRVPNQRAEMEKLLSDMFDECASYFEDIYVILGQHDSDSKTEVSEKYSTIPCITKRPNIHYVDKCHIQIDWADVYFQNYQYSKEVTCEPCDLFLTHFSLGFGQTVDNSKFRVCVCGDIHKQTQIGNIISVGTPFQHDMNCDHEGHVRLITLTDDKKIKIDNISIISDNFNPLVFAYDDEVIDTKFTNVLRFPRPTKAFSTSGIESNESSQIFNLDKYIEESLPKEFIPEWNQMKENTKDIDFAQTSLDFKILKVGAHNYWSVSDVEFDFSNDKLINLIGLNGSGKTTVVRIINSLFEPKALLKNYMNISQATSDNTCCVWGDILYEGNVYSIKRSLKTTEFWINGVQQTRNNVNQLEQYIMQCLPFIGFNKFFRLKVGSEFFNNQARIPLIQKAFNFNQMDKYANYAKQRLNEKSMTLKEVNRELVETTAILRDKLSERDTLCPNGVLPIVDESSATRKIAYDNLRSSWVEKTSAIKTLKPFISKKPEVITMSEPECDSKILEQTTCIEHYSQELNKLKEQESISKSKSEELIKLKSASYCPTCKRQLKELPQDIDTDIINYNEQVAMIKGKYEILFNNKVLAENKLKELNRIKQLFAQQTQYNETLKQYEKLTQELNEIENHDLFNKGEEINKDFEQYKTNKQILNVINNLQDRIEELNTTSERLKQDSDTIRKEVDRLTIFAKLFALNDPNSLTNDLITKICIAISDDKIKFVYNGNFVIAWLKVQNEWICYDRTSGGQRVMVDLLVMQKFSKLLGNVGFVVLDEFLAPCDANHFIECTQALENLNFNQLYYISQQDTFNIHCRRILCELGENTTTRFTDTV